MCRSTYLTGIQQTKKALRVRAVEALSNYWHRDTLEIVQAPDF